MKGTTVLGIVGKNGAALGADGQISLEDTVVKASAVKIRKLHDGAVLAGFAGATADALTLFEKFEAKLDEYSGNLARASVELAKEWRTDKYLRRLEALLIVMDKQHGFVISGNGDVIEPDDGILAIGSGGPYALAAARALVQNSKLPPQKIVEKSLLITASICIYTNDKIIIETL
jgi:ATP-dependent HslUV protease subunit HslV